jgi:eukaryotic-like serine/threonine-protein kinase
MMLWGDYEGRRLEDRWLLGRLVRPEGRRAWFEAIGPDGVPVMLSITEALNDEDELLERLRAASQVRHPNVVSIREAVISHLDDIPVVVAEMEMTDENLADVLRDRTLNAAEGRQVLDAVLAALGAMHAHGLVHKHVEAVSVVAIGESIKLRSDCVQMAASSFGTAAAEDVRWTARMVTHAVTGRYPAGDNDPVLQLLPESMARAVRRALSGIAGATEVAALAGTRLELMPERGATRMEPLSKFAAKRSASPDVVVPTEKKIGEEPRPGENSSDKKQIAMKAEAKPEAKDDFKSAPPPRIFAMRPSEMHVQGALFAEPFTLPNDRGPGARGEIDDNGPESRWPRAPYVIAAAIAVVLVTVFTLYGLLRSNPVQPKPPAPATSAQGMSPGGPVVPAAALVAQIV